MVDQTRPEQRFTAGDICGAHKLWLGGIYSWAGQYRGVNLTKGAFTFAAAGQVPRLMRELENGPLREFTPCLFGSTEEQARAIAIVHAALDRNYEPMTGVFRRIIARTEAAQARA